MLVQQFYHVYVVFQRIPALFIYLYHVKVVALHPRRLHVPSRLSGTVRSDWVDDKNVNFHIPLEKSSSMVKGLNRK